LAGCRDFTRSQDHSSPPRKTTGRSPDDYQAVAAALEARIETLQAELAKLEAAAAVPPDGFRAEARARDDVAG
jgi:uncharacterized small protein (DUF1192 family)